MVDTDIGFRHNMANPDVGFRQMMELTMKRSAMKHLVDWKGSDNRKPLVVNGARQVGKTWLVREFAQEHFKGLAHVVFLDNEEMQRAFDRSLNPKALLTFIGIATGTNPLDGETLVFLDEIQECPRAITALKLFQEQLPHIPVVAAGSLLGVALNRKGCDAQKEASVSWPVGKVSYLDMHPMTFPEFAAATEGDSLASILDGKGTSLISAFSERLTDLLRTYLFVGGMPEAVQSFVDTRDFSALREIQRELLKGYELDFSKHVDSPLMTERIRATWKSALLQLARESDMKRFTYAAIETGARGRDYRDAVSWLVDAGLVTKVPRISKPGIPLGAYADESYFKLYLLDVGLLGAAMSLSSRTIIEGNRLFTEYKGAYAEQYVCQQLAALSNTAPYYWSADGKQMKGEVDFICEFDGEVYPIEVKAAENIAGGSLAAFVKKYGIDRAIRFSLLDFRDQDWLINVPLYAVNSIEYLLEKRG